jgi:Apea-like HEPN
MNRVVMPLFNFINSDKREFMFGDGRYSLRRFQPATDIPNNMPGLSRMDMEYLKREQWALVAEDPDPAVYKEDINRLLLSFKIHTLARLFIKYRLCTTDASLCSIINQRMTFVLPEKSPRTVSFRQLEEVNVGCERLQEMAAVNDVSNRTHNAIFFMYGAYFCTSHASILFILLFTALEALFSKEGDGKGAVKTVCKRVSAFLGSKPRCTESDIKRLYNIRSELLHGRRKATEAGENLADAHELEFIVTECMKKMLATQVYLKYKNVSDKEDYFNKLISAP